MLPSEASEPSQFRRWTLDFGPQTFLYRKSSLAVFSTFLELSPLMLHICLWVSIQFPL